RAGAHRSDRYPPAAYGQIHVGAFGRNPHRTDPRCGIPRRARQTRRERQQTARAICRRRRGEVPGGNACAHGPGSVMTCCRALCRIAMTETPGYSRRRLWRENEDRMTRRRERTTTRRSFVAAAGLFGFGALVRPRPAQAAYPERPVKIVAANTPGGPSDIIARIMAAAMQEEMSATVFVENKGGA